MVPNCTLDLIRQSLQRRTKSWTPPVCTPTKSSAAVSETKTLLSHKHSNAFEWSCVLCEMQVFAISGSLSVSFSNESERLEKLTWSAKWSQQAPVSFCVWKSIICGAASTCRNSLCIDDQSLAMPFQKYVWPGFSLLELTRVPRPRKLRLSIARSFINWPETFDFNFLLKGLDAQVKFPIAANDSSSQILFLQIQNTESKAWGTTGSLWKRKLENPFLCTAFTLRPTEVSTHWNIETNSPPQQTELSFASRFVNKSLPELLIVRTSHVQVKSLFVRKILSTLRTNELMFASVTDQVALQITFVVEAFVTNLTGEVKYSFVLSQVTHVWRSVQKSSATTIAQIWHSFWSPVNVVQMSL